MCCHMGLPGATQQESEDHVELEMILGQPAGAGDSVCIICHSPVLGPVGAVLGVL